MSQIRRMPSKKLTLWLQGKVCKASKGGDDSVAIISLLCIRATSDPLTLPTPNNPFFIIILNHQQMAICLEIFVFVFPIFSKCISPQKLHSKKKSAPVFAAHQLPPAQPPEGEGKGKDKEMRGKW